jgi:hypothetical protein
LHTPGTNLTSTTAICCSTFHRPFGGTQGSVHEGRPCRLWGLESYRELQEYVAVSPKSFSVPMQTSSLPTEDTEFQGDIYANPDRKLYDALGMVSNLQATPKGEEKRSYLKRGLLDNVLWSIWVCQTYFMNPTFERLSIFAAWPSSKSITCWKARKDIAAWWRLCLRTRHVFIG